MNPSPHYLDAAKLLEVKKDDFAVSVKEVVSILMLCERAGISLAFRQGRARVTMHSRHHVQEEEGKKKVQLINPVNGSFYFYICCTDEHQYQIILSRLQEVSEYEKIIIQTEFEEPSMNGLHWLAVSLDRCSLFEHTNFLRKFCDSLKTQQAYQESTTQQAQLFTSLPPFQHFQGKAGGFNLSNELRCLKKYVEKIVSPVLGAFPQEIRTNDKEIIDQLLQEAYSSMSELRWQLKWSYFERKKLKNINYRSPYDNDCLTRVNWVIHQLSQIYLYYLFLVFKYQGIEGVKRQKWSTAIIDYHLVQFLDSYCQSLKNVLILGLVTAEQLKKSFKILIKVGQGKGREEENENYLPMLRTFCLRFLYRYRKQIDFEPYYNQNTKQYNFGRIVVTVHPSTTSHIYKINKFHFGQTKNDTYKHLVQKMWKQNRFTSHTLRGMYLNFTPRQINILTLNDSDIDKSSQLPKESMKAMCCNPEMPTSGEKHRPTDSLSKLKVSERSQQSQ